MADEDDGIGPQLPPHLLRRSGENREVFTDELDKKNSDLEGNGKAAEVDLAFFALEKEAKADTESISHASSESNEQDIFGPALPPGFVKNTNNDVKVGPALPPGWNEEAHSDSEEEDDCVIGPLPSSSGSLNDDLRLKSEIESRARAMREKLHGKNKESAPKREAWMTELPPELGANIGIVARTFKRRTLDSSDSDRSGWTDTPADRARKSTERMTKQQKADEEVVKVERKRDLEMKKKVEEHNIQYRSASLMEMHQEAQKKKNREAPAERKPFDRDTDMDTKRVDKRTASTFIKKAKGMDSRFHNSKFDSKFL